jgi:hypothetical protein
MVSPGLIIGLLVGFVCLVGIAVAIYLATRGGDSPAPSADTPASAPGPSSPAPAPGPAPVPLEALKYHYVGEGGCTNDQVLVRTACRTKTGCDTIGQQTNGCWHCLQTISTGEKSGSGYTPLLAL